MDDLRKLGDLLKPYLPVTHLWVAEKQLLPFIEAVRAEATLAERERVEKIVADLAGKYCHIVVLGEMLDDVLAAIRARTATQAEGG